jgi:hypothetical protein
MGNNERKDDHLITDSVDTKSMRRRGKKRRQRNDEQCEEGEDGKQIVLAQFKVVPASYGKQSHRRGGREQIADWRSRRRIGRIDAERELWSEEVGSAYEHRQEKTSSCR